MTKSTKSVLGDLDANGESLRELVLTMRNFFGKDIPASLLVLGGTGMSFHYVRWPTSAKQNIFFKNKTFVFDTKHFRLMQNTFCQFKTFVSVQKFLSVQNILSVQNFL